MVIKTFNLPDDLMAEIFTHGEFYGIALRDLSVGEIVPESVIRNIKTESDAIARAKKKYQQI